MVRSNLSSRAIFWLACAAVCLGSVGLGSDRAIAQVPSPEQLEIFQNLPPDQQQAILESLNRGNSGGVTNRPHADRQVKFPETVRQRTSRDEDANAESDRIGGGLPREPRLKGNDTVLLTLEIRQLERLAPEIEERERQQREQGRGQQQLVVPTQPVIPGRQQQATPGTQADTQQQQQQQQQRRLERTTEELDQLGDFRERVLRRNPYKLDKWGILTVPELGPIPLAGLTAE
jgi:polysaccharide biosynthesis/export protein